MVFVAQQAGRPLSSSQQAAAAPRQTTRRAMLLKLFITSAVTLEAPQPTAAAGPAAASTTTPAPAAGGLASAVSDADPCQHLGAVITNVTRLKRGREMMLEPGRGLLQALASQLAPGSSEGRRRGCSAALRNCFMSAEVGGACALVCVLCVCVCVCVGGRLTVGCNTSCAGCGCLLNPQPVRHTPSCQFTPSG